jgi:Leucine-rich repeat (LRR) protein
MTHAEVLGVHLPALPELDKDDVRAVRRFLPGKLLGRTAALLSLALLTLGFANLVDKALKPLVPTDLVLPAWLYFGFLLGLPLLAVASQLLVEWRAERGRRALQRLAVRVGGEQVGYFRIGPYMDTAEDRTRFDRADRGHEKVLGWIQRSGGVPLYLTGDSGSGKSSLLNAFVLPGLRDRGWTVAEARAYRDPGTAIRNALTALPATQRSRRREGQNLRGLIEAAAQTAGAGLLLVLDQFEECVLQGKQDQHQEFAGLLDELRRTPVQGLRLLLVLRSDYQTFLEDMGLPPLRYGENLYQVGRFTVAAANAFMVQSGLNLQPDALDRLLTSASELDETPGLVRPITLNVIGYVLAAGKPVAPSLDAGQLVLRYIEQTARQPAIREFAPRVLEQLVTEQGTKRPVSEEQIAVATDLRRGEVRAVLNGLGDAALARALDPAQGVWELSHDFIARAVIRHLGRRRRVQPQRAVFYAAPGLLATLLLVAVGFIAWERLHPDRTWSELARLGLTVIPAAGGQVDVEGNHEFTAERFALTGPLLAKLPPIQRLSLTRLPIADLEPLRGLAQLRSLDLNGTPVASLEPLKGLATLQKLYAVSTQVEDLEPLKGLTALDELHLGWTKIQDLGPIKALSALRILGISGTQIADLGSLAGLTGLQKLILRELNVADLEPLKGLTALRVLFLEGTQVKNLEPLQGLTALQELYLNETQVEDLKPLAGLTALQVLVLRGTQVKNLQPIRDLIALQQLNLNETQVNDLEPLKGLTGLQKLELYGTKVENLGPLRGLTALQTLNLSGTQVGNLEPIKSLTGLQTLYLNGTKVEDLEPLRELIAIHDLQFYGTRVNNLEPLRGLTELQTLALGNTSVESLEPLKGLITLRWVDLRRIRLANLEPLKGLSALRTVLLNGTQVESLEPLRGHTTLQMLDLSGTNVKNVEQLKGLTGLQRLDLSGTQVEDLEPLRLLTALQWLNLRRTKVVSPWPIEFLPALRTMLLPNSVPAADRNHLNRIREDMRLPPLIDPDRD